MRAAVAWAPRDTEAMAGIGGYGKKSPTPPKKNTAAKVRDVLKDAAEAPATK